MNYIAILRNVLGKRNPEEKQNWRYARYETGVE
jgi:hypothetical protein